MARSNVAEIDALTGAATAWDPGANGDVRAISIYGAGNVFFAGLFTSAGGASRTNLAGFESGSSTPTTFNPIPDGQVNALIENNGSLVAGGLFLTFATSPAAIYAPGYALFGG